MTVHDKGSVRFEEDQRPGEHLCQFRSEDSQDLAVCSCRVGERSEHIEYGSDADLFARPGGVLHRAVIDRGEHESNPCFGNRLLYDLRLHIEPDAAGLEQIGAAANAGY